MSDAVILNKNDSDEERMRQAQTLISRIANRPGISVSSIIIEDTDDTTKERVRLAEALIAYVTGFKHFGVVSSEWIPSWSSHLSDKMIEIVTSIPDSTIIDVVHGMWNFLGRTQTNLSSFGVSSIIEYITRYTVYRRYHVQWEQGNFDWMVADIKAGNMISAKALLALYTLHENQAIECKEEIVLALRNSDFIDYSLHVFDMRNEDEIPYGHYRIQPITVQHRIIEGVISKKSIPKFDTIKVDGVIYGDRHFMLGNVMTEVRHNKPRRWVRPLSPPVSPPSNWQELIIKYLPDENDD